MWGGGKYLCSFFSIFLQSASKIRSMKAGGTLKSINFGQNFGWKYFGRFLFGQFPLLVGQTLNIKRHKKILDNLILDTSVCPKLNPSEIY